MNKENQQQSQQGVSWFPKSSCKTNGIFLLIIIVLFLGVGGGIIWWYGRSTIQKPTETTPTEPTTFPTPTSSPTSNVESSIIPDIKIEGVPSIENASDLPTTKGVGGKFVIFNHNKKIAEIIIKDIEDGRIDVNSIYNAEIFRQTLNEAYIGVRPVGLGGYILYSGPMILYKVDFRNNSVSKLFSGKTPQNFVTDISLDGNMLVYVTGENPKKIVLKNIKEGSEKEFPVPNKYKQVGDALFSPNSEKIAYAVGISNPDDEKGTAFIIDIKTGKQTEIISARHNGAVSVIGWYTNDVVNVNKY